MLATVGGVLDRVGSHVLTILGVVGLALAQVLYPAMVDEWGSNWAVFVVVFAAVAAASGSIGSLVQRALAYRTARSEEMTAIQATLIPIAKRFIEISRSGGPANLEDLVTEVTMHCRAFVSSNGTDSDANYYRLEAGRRLVRVNRAAVGARDSFEKNIRRDEVSREENAVVERVLRKEPVFCNDISSKRLQEKYQLQNRKRKYGAFLSVPVYSGGTIWGMLSVNSSKKRKLSVQHQGYMEAVAVLLAAIEDGQSTRGPSTGATSVAGPIMVTEEG